MLYLICVQIKFMLGFSISIMKVVPVTLQQLHAPTKAPYWPVAADGW